MRIGPDTTIWVVTDPGPHSTLGDVCAESNLRDLALQVAGGLDLATATLYTAQDEAEADGRNRLLVWRVARQVRIDRRLAPDEAVRVTLHGEDGRVLFRGDVR